MTDTIYSHKIKPEHLARKAIVYLRQSTDRQVIYNKESQILQYGKRVGTSTLRRDAGACWRWGMDMPDLPVIETGDTHKIGRKSVRRLRVESRDGLGRKGSRGDSAVSSSVTG
jgi:hypothetical protein